MSGGRTIFVACQGQPAAGRGGNFAKEFAAFGIDPSSRMRRMEEAVDIMRLLTSEESASYEGEYNRFENDRPAEAGAAAGSHLARSQPGPGQEAERRDVERVVRYGDGWQTTWNTPGSFAQHLSTIKGYAEEEDRDLGEDFEACLYYNINVGEEREAALDEAKRFLDAYYTDYDRSASRDGSPTARPRVRRADPAFIEAGATTVTLRMAAYDQKGQFERVTREVLPALKAAFAERYDHALRPRRDRRRRSGPCHRGSVLWASRSFSAAA